MKILDGRELVGYIKERQAKQVRGLRQTWGVYPKLSIILTGRDRPSEVYADLKKRYGDDILINVDTYRTDVDDAVDLIDKLNNDDGVHGIVVQLPLSDVSRTDEILSAINSAKDVDGLSGESEYVSATAEAIDWLLAGYNIDLQSKKIVIVGRGRLVGAPLEKYWSDMGLKVESIDDTTPNIQEKVRQAGVVISATGVPGLITGDMLAHGAIVVDAGTASENGKLVGDVADEARQRDDLTITPVRGGVGPLTVALLFDHVIRSARRVADQG